MGDYSPHVLDRARQAVAHHGDQVSALVWTPPGRRSRSASCAARPSCVYISNVYDNLPTDEVARIGGPHLPGRGRAYLPDGTRAGSPAGSAPAEARCPS